MAGTTEKLDLGGGNSAQLRDLKRMPRRVQLEARRAAAAVAQLTTDEMVINLAAFDVMFAWAIVSWTLDLPLPSESNDVWDDMEAATSNVFYQVGFSHLMWLNAVLTEVHAAKNPDGYKDPNSPYSKRLAVEKLVLAGPGSDAPTGPFPEGWDRWVEMRVEHLRFELVQEVLGLTRDEWNDLPEAESAQLHSISEAYLEAQAKRRSQTRGR